MPVLIIPRKQKHLKHLLVQAKLCIHFIIIIVVIIFIIIIIIIIIHSDFFIPTLADGLPLEFEREQVSSCLYDSSQHSDRSQQCCSLDALDSSSDF